MSIVITRLSVACHGTLRKSARDRKRLHSDLSTATAELRLQDVSLELSAGTLTLLVGPPGAGKTTLLESIAGLWAPENGLICIEGHPLWLQNHLNASARYAVSLSQQQPEQQLFAQTVQAELAYVLSSQMSLTRTERAERMLSALRAVGLSPDIALKSPMQLSGGQKRKVALACTILTEPRWLLFDEPTAALDPQAAQSFVAFVEEQAHEHGRGVIVATHDLELLARVADQVVRLERGRVVQGLAMDTTAQSVQRALTAHGVHIAPQALDAPALAKALTAARAAQETHLHAQVVEDLVLPSAVAPLMDDRGYQGDDGSYDPRALWLAYGALSAAILLQNQPSGLAAAAVYSLWWLRYIRAPWRQAMRSLRGFTLFAGIAALLAGIQLHTKIASGFALPGLSVDSTASLHSALSLARIFLLLMLGTALTLRTSFLQMKWSLRQLLRPFEKIGAHTESIALGIALTVRFIPIIREEAERMRRIVRLRGGRRRSSRRKRSGNALRLRDLRLFTFPLPLCVLQGAEDLATHL